MAESLFRETLVFFGEVGLYDVVLPFLLVFTIMFAILEKTKVLGVRKADGREFTKKNLNSIVAFVVGFLVIASAQLVSIINETLANMVLLLILSISFMILVGSLHGDEEFNLKNFPGWLKFFMILMFVGISLIFLNALDWLNTFLSILTSTNGEWLNSLIFLVITGVFIWLITNDPKEKKTKN